MKAAELWNKFIEKHLEHKDTPYEAWSYGVDPDELAELTLKGVKTATTSGYDLYELEKESLPKENEFNIILDGSDNAVCITETTKVYVVPFDEVTEDHAFKEGEGDRTLAYWRNVHTNFFEKEYAEYNVAFHEQAWMVCEEFEVVY